MIQLSYSYSVEMTCKYMLSLHIERVRTEVGLGMENVVENNRFYSSNFPPYAAVSCCCIEILEICS